MKKAIYTVILNDYDELHDPVVMTPDWDYICFTDDPDLRSKYWDIRIIEKDPDLSYHKMAKKVIILYHHFVPEYDLTVLVPGYAEIKCNLDDFMTDPHAAGNFYRDFYDIAFLSHPRPRSVYRDAKMMAKCMGDPENMIKKQMIQYMKEGMPRDDDIRTKPHPTGILIRKGGRANLERHCELWWEEVKKHSPRDQLALAYIIWKYNLVKFKIILWRNFVINFLGQDHHKRMTPLNV